MGEEKEVGSGLNARWRVLAVLGTRGDSLNSGHGKQVYGRPSMWGMGAAQGAGVGARTWEPPVAAVVAVCPQRLRPHADPRQLLLEGSLRLLPQLVVLQPEGLRRRRCGLRFPQPLRGPELRDRDQSLSTRVKGLSH